MSVFTESSDGAACDDADHTTGIRFQGDVAVVKSRRRAVHSARATV
jgi:hypothetical protein